MAFEVQLTRLTGFDRGKSLKVSTSEVVLGTDAGCHVRFDPTWDKTVSARHAILRLKKGSVEVEDVSRDGTLVGGRRVKQESIEPGTILELGRGGPTVRVDFEPVAEEAPSDPVGETAPPPLTTSAAPAPPVVASTPSGTPKETVKPRPQAEAVRRPWWAYAAFLVLFGVLLLGGLVLYQRESPEQALAGVAREYGEAVGLVVIVHPELEGGRPTPMATAWAIGPRVFATNSHVSEPVAEVLDNRGTAYIVINRSPDTKLRITRAVVHPRYGEEELNFEGKPHAVPAYDVGLLYTEDPAPKVFRLGARRELENLDSGYRIGYLGFPMEGMAGGGVEMRSPVATMQSGIVTSVTDYWLSSGPFERRFLVQHNLGATGGASGSPIFNAKGEVVAILNAGNIIGTVSFETGQVTRAPSGVMVNFAQRVDLLRDIYPEFP